MSSVIETRASFDITNMQTASKTIIVPNIFGRTGYRLAFKYPTMLFVIDRSVIARFTMKNTSVDIPKDLSKFKS